MPSISIYIGNIKNSTEKNTFLKNLKRKSVHEVADRELSELNETEHTTKMILKQQHYNM